MYGKFLPILLGVYLGLQAQATITVDELVSFIRSAIQRKQDDRQVATYLLKVHLSNRLDDRTIEDLQVLGAGVKAVAALRVLRDASARLSPPPPPTEVKAPPSPSAAEQKKVLAEATEYALNYELYRTLSARRSPGALKIRTAAAFVPSTPSTNGSATSTTTKTIRSPC